MKKEWLILIVWCLTPLLAIFQTISLRPVLVVEETGVPGKNHGQATGKLYHLRLRVKCTLFCKLQSWVRTHGVLMIGLYELLVIHLLNSLSHPGPLMKKKDQRTCRYKYLFLRGTVLILENKSALIPQKSSLKLISSRCSSFFYLQHICYVW